MLGDRASAASEPTSPDSTQLDRRSALPNRRSPRWPKRRPQGNARLATTLRVMDVDGLNAGYASALLEQYLENPDAVPAEWRALFESGDSDARRGAPGPRAAARALRAAATATVGPCRRPRPPHLQRPPPRPLRPDEQLLGGVAAAMALVKALPHARPSRRAPRPARLRAGRRSRARARAADPS